MAKLPPRHSQAGLASALAVLDEAARRYPGSPDRMQEAADRVAFRIRAEEDLFQFCPFHGELPMGGGTIWGLICESSPIVAGVLIRRFLVERLGDELELRPGHADAVLFALEEYPDNIGLLEIVSRSPALRAEYCQLGGRLDHIAQALETLRTIVTAAPPDRIQTDRGFVGLTSGLHGVRDSHVYYAEPDLLRAIVELLLAPECQGLPAAAARAGGAAAAALRRICVLTVDLCGQLRAHSRVVARCFALLGSALPLAFGDDRGEVNADFWVLVHMLASSDCGGFIEDVLNESSRTRLHDVADLQAFSTQLFGQGRPEDSRRRGRAALLADARLALCHVLLVLFGVMESLHHRSGQPDRFAQLAVDTMRSRLLPALRRALDGGAAGRWPAVREALGALTSAAERAPLPADERDWLKGAHAAFRSFAVGRFVPAEGLVRPAEAEVQLDPFGHPAAVSAAASFKASVARADGAPVGVAQAAAPPALSSAVPPTPRSARSLGLPVERSFPSRGPSAEPASPAASASLTASRGYGDRDRGRLPFGSTSSPRRPDVQFVPAAEAASRRSPPTPSELDPRGLLPRPLPFAVVPDKAEGSMAASMASKRAMQRGGLPPLASRLTACRA